MMDKMNFKQSLHRSLSLLFRAKGPIEVTPFEDEDPIHMAGRAVALSVSNPKRKVVLAFPEANPEEIYPIEVNSRSDVRELSHRWEKTNSQFEKLNHS